MRYYVCSTYYSKTKAACRGQYIKAEPVEAQAREILRVAVSAKPIVEMAKDELKKMAMDRNPELLSAIRLAERQLRELSEKHRKLLELRYQDAVSVDQFKVENGRILEQQKISQESLDQLQQQQRMIHTQSAALDKTFEILMNFETLYNDLDFKTKRELYNIVFKFAHAKCLGIRKPKFIDHYELNGPFPQVSMEGGDDRTQNASKLLCENLDIQSYPTAAR